MRMQTPVRPGKAGRGAGPKLALGDGPSFRSVALLFRGHLKEGAQKSNEGAQESKGGGGHKHRRRAQRHGMSL